MNTETMNAGHDRRGWKRQFGNPPLLRYITHVRKEPVPLDISLEDNYSSPKSTETIRTSTKENSHGYRTS